MCRAAHHVLTCALAALGVLVAAVSSGSHTAAIEFVAGGSTEVRIEARDVQGPFRLKALE